MSNDMMADQYNRAAKYVPTGGMNHG